MNRSIARALLLALACLSAALGAVGRSAAQDATPTAGIEILPPDAVVEGLTLGEWEARQWQWAVSFSNDVSPLLDEVGDRCGYGQFGPVFMLPGTFLPEPPDLVTCVVPAGVTILVPITGVECSTVEPPPFFGRDEAELRDCAESQLPPIAELGLEVSIDGEAVADLEQYRSSSPLFTMTFPEDNAFGVPAGVANAVAVGYALLLAPPPVGEFEIRYKITGPDGTVLPDFVFRIVVAEPMVIEPAASPEAGTPDAATPAA